ncbi:hypothetical protein VTO73DRAFT_1855 [Trametes versicolor]
MSPSPVGPTAHPRCRPPGSGTGTECHDDLRRCIPTRPPETRRTMRSPAGLLRMPRPGIFTPPPVCVHNCVTRAPSRHSFLRAASPRRVAIVRISACIFPVDHDSGFGGAPCRHHILPLHVPPLSTQIVAESTSITFQAPARAVRTPHHLIYPFKAPNCDAVAPTPAPSGIGRALFMPSRECVAMLCPAFTPLLAVTAVAARHLRPCTGTRAA